MTQIADVDYKKILISDVAADGGLGTQWKKIEGDTRQGTAALMGSDATVTAHKNVIDGVIRSSSVRGDNNFNFQCADISALNRSYFMGGEVVTDSRGVNYKAPSQKQDINKSVMIIGTDNTVDYAINVNIEAYMARADDDLAYIQVNGLVQDSEKEGVESNGSWDSIDPTKNDIETFVLAEETGAATIDAVAKTVAIEVANGTDVTGLIPTITVSLGANATPNSLEVQDFTSPVVYAIENADGISEDWTVTVTVAA